MLGTISFGGLISGLDSKEITDKLVALKEEQLVAPVVSQIQAIQGKQAALAPVVTGFEALQDAAETLKDTLAETFKAMQSTSADTSILSIAATTSKAVPGTYAVTSISQLAQPDRVIFNGVADQDTSQFGTGTLTFTYKGVESLVVIDSTNNTLDGIAAAINNADFGVTAAIINDGDASTPYRLTLTSDDTGSDTTITQDIASVLTLTLDSASSSSADNEPADAALIINGISMTSKSNTVSDAIAGVTFNLLKTETTDTINITVTQDFASIKAKISTFVTAYNTMRNTLKATLSINENSHLGGPLSHDVTMSAANVRINATMGEVLKGLTGYDYNSLAQIGITGDGNGSLTVNDDDLTSALEKNPEDVRVLFQGTSTVDGIAKKMYDYVKTLTQADGIFEDKSEAYQTSVDRLNKRITELAERIVAYEELLNRRFTRMELVLNNLQAQEGQITAYSDIYQSKSNLLL